MTQEIVRKEEAGMILDVQGIAALEKLGAYLSKSGMFPNIRTPEQAMTVVQYGRELGVGPVVALQEIFVIQGRLSTSAKFMLALFQREGGRHEVLEWTPTVCRVKVSKANFGDLDYAYTIEQAKQAGLAGKDNWVRTPKQMLFARAISGAIRAFDPMSTMGLYTPEEIEEIIEEAPSPGIAKAEAYQAPNISGTYPPKPEDGCPGPAQEAPATPAVGPLPPGPAKVEDKPEEKPAKLPKAALKPKPAERKPTPSVPAPLAAEVMPRTDPRTGEEIGEPVVVGIIRDKIAFIEKEYGIAQIATLAKNRAEKQFGAKFPDFPFGLDDDQGEEIVKVLEATIQAAEKQRAAKEGAK